MSMKGWMVASLLLFLLPLAGMAAQRPTYEMVAVGEIEVGPDGAVQDYQIDDKLAPGVRSAVDKNVRLWKFEPILVDGKPVIATTRMRLTLTAEPVEGDQYALKVVNVWFGEPERKHALTPPMYPGGVYRAGLGGKVMLILKLDADGNVVDVLPEQTSLSTDVEGKAAERWRRMLEESSVAAARAWKFSTTETIDGEAIGSLVRVPVMFHYDKKRWQTLIPGPVHPIPWMTKSSVASQQARDALDDGQAQPLDSRFKLKQDVIGTTL